MDTVRGVRCQPTERVPHDFRRCHRCRDGLPELEVAALDDVAGHSVTGRRNDVVWRPPDESE